MFRLQVELVEIELGDRDGQDRQHHQHAVHAQQHRGRNDVRVDGAVVGVAGSPVVSRMGGSAHVNRSRL